MKLYPKVIWHQSSNTYEIDEITLTADQVYALKEAYTRTQEEKRPCAQQTTV